MKCDAMQCNERHNKHRQQRYCQPVSPTGNLSVSLFWLPPVIASKPYTIYKHTHAIQTDNDMNVSNGLAA